MAGTGHLTEKQNKQTNRAYESGLTNVWHPGTGEEKAGSQISKLSQLRSEFKDSVDYYMRL